eukprot:4660748-Prymnesium_polylepis.2
MRRRRRPRGTTPRTRRRTLVRGGPSTTWWRASMRQATLRCEDECPSSPCAHTPRRIKCLAHRTKPRASTGTHPCSRCLCPRKTCSQARAQCLRQPARPRRGYRS